MTARLLVLLAIVAGGAWWWTHRGIDNAAVDAFYREQVDAFVQGDPKRLCAQYADDYRGNERQVGPLGAQEAIVDKAQSCAGIAALFDFKKKYEAQRGEGVILATSLNLEPGDVRVARDGKSADVHLKVHMNFGGALEARSEGTEHLVKRNGRVLSAGSDMVSHVDGPLAGVPDPAAMAAVLARRSR